MRRVQQLAEAAAGVQAPRFTAFLSDRQQHLAKAALAAGPAVCHSFFGGYQGAERAMLCVFADNLPPPVFPIVALRLLPAGESPGHRDYLGALLGLGLKRETLGDIRALAEGALVFVQEALAPLVLDELRQVGRVAVRVERAGSTVPPLAAPETESFVVSLPSLRADALLAAALKLNRAAAQQLFQAGLVQINHLPAESAGRVLQEGDILSVRGHGKYRYDHAEGKSKKNRILARYSVFK